MFFFFINLHYSAVAEYQLKDRDIFGSNTSAQGRVTPKTFKIVLTATLSDDPHINMFE